MTNVLHSVTTDADRRAGRLCFIQPDRQWPDPHSRCPRCKRLMTIGDDDRTLICDRHPPGHIELANLDRRNEPWPTRLLRWLVTGTGLRRPKE